ncbi:MAG: MSMEG_4193 family putative phosphomutase [Acidimicrobiia bacterium]|nr:MSMEG_4193 family putative phosphomutase [Acidimicrobiia bacterium]
MARVLLVRHAPTPETGSKLTGRLPGVSLDERGVEMARRTAAKLANVKLKAIYSSPIERTWETAIEIAAPHGLTPLREGGVIEVDYGDWSGRSLKSLYRLKAWRTVQRHPSRMTFPNGENLADMQRRAVAAVDRIAASHAPSQTVAIVTHGDVIKAVTAHHLGTPLDLFQRIAVSPASVTVIDIPRDGGPTVLAVNTNGDPTPWR